MKQLLTLLFIGLTSLYAQTVPSYVPTNGLVGWWPFNGNANDESGNGYNGTVFGATLTSDRNGNNAKAYSFNGNSDYVRVSNLSLNTTGSLSVSMWVKINPVNNYQVFLSKGPKTAGHFEIYSFVGNQKLSYNTFDLCQNAQSTFSIADNQTHHIIIIQANGFVKFYVDNIFVNQLPCTGTLANVTNDLTIGKIDDNFPYFTSGIIDDIGIWNRELSQQEIHFLHTACNDSLQIQPQNFTAYTGTGWANFKCKSTDTSATYQWQQNIGSGWSNISNFGSYSGATSDSLVITGVTASMNNYGYRCIVESCTTDTSDVAVLTVANGIGLGESTLDKLTISPNPTNGFVSLNTSVVGNYELLTLDGRILESGTAKKDYDLTTYPKGVYHLRLSTDEGTRVLKVVKN